MQLPEDLASARLCVCDHLELSILCRARDEIDAIGSMKLTDR